MGKEISLVPQDPMSGLNPVLTIGEQVTETIQAHEDVRRGEARRRAAELLAAVGIPRPGDQLGRYPHQFSGGMRQRVLIAIALALRPTLLIADEPTTALDVTVQAQVLELLHELTVERGTAILLISHDLGIMARMTRRIAVMYAGHVVESAPTAEVFARPHHPYTVGLLRSIPRVGDVGAAADPHRRRAARRRPAAARLPVRPPVRLGAGGLLGGDAAARRRWRRPLAAEEPGPGAGAHLLACHNPVRRRGRGGRARCGPGSARPRRRPSYGPVIEETA